MTLFVFFKLSKSYYTMFSKKQYTYISKTYKVIPADTSIKNAQYELHRKFLHSASVSMVIVIQNMDEKILEFPNWKIVCTCFRRNFHITVCIFEDSGIRLFS